MSNTNRALWGARAVTVGTPDFGMNGEDLAGVQTDSVDTVANILHFMARASEHPLDAVVVLDSARMHFEAEVEPEWTEVEGKARREAEDEDFISAPPERLVVLSPAAYALVCGLVHPASDIDDDGVTADAPIWDEVRNAFPLAEFHKGVDEKLISYIEEEA
jgi:hypothetical protein